jgi:hypothetical protein
MSALDDCVAELRAISVAISMSATDPVAIDLADKLKTAVVNLAAIVDGGEATAAKPDPTST